MYSGIHYDSAVVNPDALDLEDFDTRLFATQDGDNILKHLKALADVLREKHYCMYASCNGPALTLMAASRHRHGQLYAQMRSLQERLGWPERGSVSCFWLVLSSHAILSTCFPGAMLLKQDTRRLGELFPFEDSADMDFFLIRFDILQRMLNNAPARSRRLKIVVKYYLPLLRCTLTGNFYQPSF